MNILFLADPGSIHDIKWMSFFSEGNNCYLLTREKHWIEQSLRSEFEKSYQIRLLDNVKDFSTVFFWRNFKQINKIRRLLETYKIDIFHIMYGEPNVLWANFSRKILCPIILTTRGTDILKTIPETFTKPGLINYFVSKLYRRALLKVAFITCTSHQQVRNITRLTNRQKSIEIVRTGVDKEEIQKDTSSYLPEELKGKRFVLFPRNMKPIYNHELSLEAIRMLSKEILSTYLMVFLDSNNSDISYVKTIKRKMLSIKSANFCFLLKQSQRGFWELLKKAELAVMNPISDGVPVTALEAMACGTRLILGTAAYDEDVFEEVPRISKDSAKELSSKIEEQLTVASAKSQYPTIDRKVEMQKLQRIYHDVQRELATNEP